MITDRLLSSEVGIVHRLESGMTSFDHPRLATVFAETCDTTPLFGSTLAARAGGAAGDRPSAMLAAAGEAVERYSARHVPTSILHRARVSDFSDAPLVEPQWLDQPDAQHEVLWAPGCKLGAADGGEPAWVAASRVYLADIDDGAPVAVPTSSGLAAHPDPWLALRAALLEVIERDAVMTAWYHRRPGRALDTPQRWTTATGRELRFDRAIERYELFQLESPVDVAVVLAVAFGGPMQPPVAVGAAADIDLVRAARRALIEARQTFTWAERMLASGVTAAADAAVINDLDDHVAYYLEPGRLTAFSFLNSADRSHSFDLEAATEPDEPEPSCRDVIKRLTTAGLPAFAVDATAPDVRELSWWVIRAVVPDLYPLVVGNQLPDHPRLPRALAGLAPDPHPFP